MTLKIIKVGIDSIMLNNAIKRSNNMGSLHGSIEEGKANIQGMLGEEIVKKKFGCNYDDNRGFSELIAYDFIINGMKIDVKSKQTINGINSNMETSIYNPNQKCDAYIFCRIMKDRTHGFILGWLSKEEYFDKAELITAGTVDKTNGFTHKRNCYNLRITELRNIEELCKKELK